MKRLCAGLITLFLCALPIVAQTSIKNSDIIFSIQPAYSIENGVLNEFVYKYDDAGTLFKLSELNWNIVNSHNFGASIKFGWKYVYINTDFSLGMSARSGYMYDSDWLHPNDHSIKTTYSINENYLNKRQALQIGINGKIPCIPERVRNVFSMNLCPYFNYDYILYSFSGNNGYGWYGNKVTPIVEYTDPNAIFYCKGQLFGIDYEREHTNFYHGLLIECIFFQRLLLTCDFGISLNTKVNSIDTHYNGSDKTIGTNYLDIMESKFNTFTISSSFEYNFWDGFHFGIGYTYFNMGITPGINKEKSLTAKEYIKTNIVSKCSGETHTFKIYLGYTL